MNVYFVRHGETKGDAQLEDDELSDLGVKQAKILATRFSRIPIDVIYSSPTKRAQQTTEIVSESLKKEVVYSDFLKKPKGLEDFASFQKRIEKFFDILSRNEKENILVITHASPIIMMIFLMSRNNFSERDFNNFSGLFKLDNTGITLCKKDDNKKWVVKFFNDHAHLL